MNFTNNLNDWYTEVENTLISDMKSRNIGKVTIHITKYEVYALLPYQNSNGSTYQQEYTLHESLRVVEKLRKAGLQVEFVGMTEKLVELGIEQELNGETRLEIFVDANIDSIIEIGYTKDEFTNKVRNLSDSQIETLRYVANTGFKEEAKKEANILLNAHKDFTSITASFFFNCLHKQVHTDTSNLPIGCYVKTEGGKDIGFVSEAKNNKITIVSIYGRFIIGGAIDEVETKAIKKSEIIMVMQPKDTNAIMQALHTLKTKTF